MSDSGQLLVARVTVFIDVVCFKEFLLIAFWYPLLQAQEIIEMEIAVVHPKLGSLEAKLYRLKAGRPRLEMMNLHDGTAFAATNTRQLQAPDWP